jgi:hypothetical protein
MNNDSGRRKYRMLKFRELQLIRRQRLWNFKKFPSNDAGDGEKQGTTLRQLNIQAGENLIFYYLAKPPKGG